VRELERADVILHAGDVVAGSVLADLEAFAPVEAVFGNMDEPALKEALPERRVVEVERLSIGSCTSRGRGKGGRSGWSRGSPGAPRSCTGTRTSRSSSATGAPGS